jgi:hypothetical protein
MIMMPYRRPWPSPQLTGQADFWHPTRADARRASRATRLALLVILADRGEWRHGMSLTRRDRHL